VAVGCGVTGGGDDLAGIEGGGRNSLTWTGLEAAMLSAAAYLSQSPAYRDHEVTSTQKRLGPETSQRAELLFRFFSLFFIFSCFCFLFSLSSHAFVFSFLYLFMLLFSLYSFCFPFAMFCQLRL
jgi:hypothetical protein